MSQQYCANEYRNTLLCIDSYENCEMKGRFYNPAQDGAYCFSGVMTFLLGMEQLLDGMKFPQAFQTRRSFSKTESAQTSRQDDPRERQGERATFLVKVFFRQNASWQGTVSWVDEGREESFRSTLELLLLLDSALDTGQT